MHKSPQEAERLTDQQFELPDQVSLQQLLPGTYTAIFGRAGDLVASVCGGAATGTAPARLRAAKWGVTTMSVVEASTCSTLPPGPQHYVSLHVSEDYFRADLSSSARTRRGSTRGRGV